MSPRIGHLEASQWAVVLATAWLWCACTGESGSKYPATEMSKLATSNSGEDSSGRTPVNRTPTPSTCDFSAEGTLSAPAADGFVEVPPQHPHIFYMGRFDCNADGGPTFAFPGVSIRVRFEGEALSIRLVDHAKAEQHNYYDVILDGAPTQLLEVLPDQELYPLVEGLAAGPHVVELVKRTESNWGSGTAQFRGFRIRGNARLLPIQGRPRRLEFVGDSITCGYGNELAVSDPSNAHFTTRNENANAAYGALVASALDAEYVLVAASGRGVSRNWQGEPGRLVPEIHRLALPDGDNPPAWDYARFQPEVTVVNLGTNDFSPGGVNREVFRSRYVAFLEHMRAVYPKTFLLLVLGPMLNDGFPPGESALTNIRADLRAVMATRQQAGDALLDLIEVAGQQAPFGEDWHPSRQTHQQMAEVIRRYLVRLGW